MVSLTLSLGLLLAFLVVATASPLNLIGVNQAYHTKQPRWKKPVTTSVPATPAAEALKAEEAMSTVAPVVEVEEKEEVEDTVVAMKRRALIEAALLEKQEEKRDENEEEKEEKEEELASSPSTDNKGTEVSVYNGEMIGGSDEKLFSLAQSFHICRRQW